MQNIARTSYTFISAFIAKYCRYSIPANMDILKFKEAK